MGWNEGREVPARFRTVIPSVGACVLALAVALVGARVDARPESASGPEPAPAPSEAPVVVPADAGDPCSGRDAPARSGDADRALIVVLGSTI